MKRGRRSGNQGQVLKRVAKKRFLEELAGGRTVTGAARVADRHYRTMIRYRSEDPKFAAAWLEAVEKGTDALVDEAKRRATDGVDEPVYYKGKVVGTVRRYSDLLLMFLLKSRRPDIFRDNVKAEIVGAGGVPIQPVINLTLAASASVAPVAPDPADES